MGFPFAWVCDLLEDLEKLASAPLLPNILKRQINDKTVQWLRNHCRRLNAHDTDADIVIQMFKPETYKYHGLATRDLEQIIARALSLPRKHIKTLQEWRQEPPKGDLALCVEKVLEEVSRCTQEAPVQLHGNSFSKIRPDF